MPIGAPERLTSEGENFRPGCGPSATCTSGYPENRAFVQELRPEHAGDWLLVAGDVAERFADIEWALGLLQQPVRQGRLGAGQPRAVDPPATRSAARRGALPELVRMCRRLGCVTPEDPYPVWDGAGGPATIAPLFVLYDYTFRVPGGTTKEESLALAYEAGVVCTDEALLHPDPYPSREAWCDARLAETERRLAGRDPALPTVLVNHYPLVREPTDVLWYPEFAQWCGTEPHRRLAPALRRRHGGLRAPAHPPHHASTTACGSRRSRWATPASGSPEGRCPTPCAPSTRPTTDAGARPSAVEAVRICAVT